MLLLDTAEVECWELQRSLGVDILVECTHEHDRQRRENQIVQDHKGIVEQKQGRESKRSKR
jgi:hypothetical protein